MTSASRLLSPACKALTLASLLTAIALEAWLGRAVYAALPLYTALAAACGFAGARLAPGATLALVLPFGYVLPAVFFLLVGVYWTSAFLLWAGALTGILLADCTRLAWAYPRRWTLPLALWGLTVAIAWPIVALRELDLAPRTLLAPYNVPNTRIGGSPEGMAIWTMHTAMVHLLGLLWFDWLCARFAGGARFERRIAVPLAAGAVGASLVGIYQGAIDITFLGPGVWIDANRAAGPLMDGNAFGMLAAMWTAGLLALSSRVVPLVPALAGALLCAAGVWMSGSRTALLVTCAGVGAAALFAAPRSLRTGKGRLVAASVTAALGLAAVLVLSGAGPLGRLRNTLPAELSTRSIAAALYSLWDRDGYGTAAAALIQEHPVVGTGIGSFNMMGAGYLLVHLAPKPPDNAQNWWRHQVVELGLLGAAGPILWTVLFLHFLVTSRAAPGQGLPTAALKGTLVGFGAISLVGMPAQALPVSLTFWIFAFWLTTLAPPPDPPPGRPVAAGWWGGLVLLVLLHAAATAIEGRGALRPAVRAAEGGWRYDYGMQPAAGSDAATRTLVERRGVAVVPLAGEWMMLSVRADHPDLEARPVRALLRVNGQTVVDARLHTSDPLRRLVWVGPAARAILEARVDRTWRAEDAPPGEPSRGLVLSWSFLPEAPAGVPVVRAPGYGAARP